MLLDDIEEYAHELIDTLNNYTVDLMINAGIVMAPDPPPEQVFLALQDMESRGYDLALYKKRALEFDVLFHSAILLSHYGKFIKGYEVVGMFEFDDIRGVELKTIVSEVGDIDND